MTENTEKATKTGLVFTNVSNIHWSDLNVNTSEALMEGFIYILSNESLPGVYKIGLTTRQPEQRVNELSKSTSIPTPFKLEGAWHSNDLAETESQIHKHLANERVSEQREFFKGDINYFKSVVGDFCEMERGSDEQVFHDLFKYTAIGQLTSDSVSVLISRDTYNSLIDNSYGDTGLIVDGMIRMFIDKSPCNLNIHNDQISIFESPEDEHLNEHFKTKNNYIVPLYNKKAEQDNG